MANTNPTPLEATILSVAALPQTSTVDGTSTTERSAADMIALDQQIAGNAALRKRGFGLIRQKISRGNALGGHS